MRRILFVILILPHLLLGQADDFWNNKRAQIDLANFLDAQLITGYNFESDVTFPFSAGKFPELELSSPATAKIFMGGDYGIKVRWFDTDLNEVEKPERPGRYAYYAEIEGSNGIKMRKAATLFCTPKDWMVWSEEIKADIDYFPFDGVAKEAWEPHEEAISIYAGKIILESVINHQKGDVLMAFIHEAANKKLTPGPLNIPSIVDGEYHIKLKQKVLGVENSYSSLNPPTFQEELSPRLQKLSASEQKKFATFQKEMQDLCGEWAEESREPFDMLIAQDGKVLIHQAFGENLRGKFTTDEPTEVASITKLYTGLLFAQFVEQGLMDTDDFVGKFLPDFPTEGERAITLRQCFTHTTGLVGHGSMGGVYNPWLDNSFALWLPHLDVGTYHWYNGMGYNLAGKVMEIVSGKSIFRLMHEQLFQPLNLENTRNDTDLAYGIKSTAYDLAVVGQMFLNKGSYGSVSFFSPDTYEELLPVDLETYFPKIKGKTWGIGVTPMNTYIEDPKTGKKRAILSDELIGHGSATSSILRVDPKNQIVIAQSRMDAGKSYEAYLQKALLLMEKYLSK